MSGGPAALQEREREREREAGSQDEGGVIGTGQMVSAEEGAKQFFFTRL